MLGDYYMHVAIGQRQATTAVLHVRGGAPPVVPPGQGQMVS
jgi:hypothetical protein